MSERPELIITHHAVVRWQQRIERISDADAVTAILKALASANDKHFKPAKLKKRTFYIPTDAAMFVGSRGKIMTVMARGQAPFDNSEGKWKKIVQPAH